MSNGTPDSWRKRAAAQPPRRIVVSGRPDPIQLPETGGDVPSAGHDLAALLLAVAIIAGLAFIAVSWPGFVSWLG